MPVSGLSMSDISSLTFLWVAAVLMTFFGLASIVAELFFAFPGSLFWVLFVPAADAWLVGIFEGGGSLVPLVVFWVKHDLVLCPSRPHLRQSASLVLYSWNSSSGVSFMAALKDSHRISYSRNLSFLLGPSRLVVTAGAFFFSLASVAFCTGFPFRAASFSFSFCGRVTSFFAASTRANSSSSIPASWTA